MPGEIYTASAQSTLYQYQGTDYLTVIDNSVAVDIRYVCVVAWP